MRGYDKDNPCTTNSDISMYLFAKDPKNGVIYVKFGMEISFEMIKELQKRNIRIIKV